MTFEWKGVRSVVGVIAVCLLLAGVAGCPPTNVTTVQPVEDPKPMRTVIDRVNANNGRMDFLLRAGGVSARIRYADRSGTARMEFRGVLIFRKPRDLYLQLSHVGQKAMEVGSNNEEFWVWKRVQDPTYWWGEYACMGRFLDAEVPVRPDILVEVLGLSDLVEQDDSEQALGFWVWADRYQLDFWLRDEQSEWYHAKSIEIDRRPPFLVRSVVYYGIDGYPVVNAKLSKYDTVEGSDVLAPRRIEIEWVNEERWARLDFATVKRFDSEAAKRYFVSPRSKGLDDLGQVIRMDDAMKPGKAPSAVLPTQSAEIKER